MSFDPGAQVDDRGVIFRMHFPDRDGTAVVTADTLKRYFGASDDAGTLLDAYRANFRTIHAVAQQQEAAGNNPPVVDAAAIQRAETAGMRI